MTKHTVKGEEGAENSLKDKSTPLTKNKKTSEKDQFS
jgi:hypothetical protein